MTSNLYVMSYDLNRNDESWSFHLVALLVCT